MGEISPERSDESPSFFVLCKLVFSVNFVDAQPRVKRGSGGIGGISLQQAGSLDDNRGTACEDTYLSGF